jgi:polar amino acid transport system permease protein
MTQFFEDARQFMPILLQGAYVTVQVAFLSLALSTVLGLTLALMRMSGNPLFYVPAVTVITGLRGIPIIVQLMYIYFVLPEIGIDLSAFTAGVIGLGVAYSAYHAENFRAAILAVDRGQYEAALSIGMGKAQLMRRIILPQALRIMLPPYGNITIMMLKDSGQLIASSTFKNMTVFTLVAFIYLVMSLPLTGLNSWLERRFAAK